MGAPSGESFQSFFEDFANPQAEGSILRDYITMSRDSIQLLKVFKCPLCPRTFPQKQYLTMHLKSHEGSKHAYSSAPEVVVMPKIVEIKSEAFLLHCNMCNTNVTSMEEHMNNCDSRHKHHICKVCTKSYRTKIELQKHSLEHGVNNLQCSICGQQFQWRYSLDSHMRLHTGDKPFKCHLCSRQFNLKTSLNRHFSDVHGMKLEDNPPPNFEDVIQKMTIMKEKRKLPELVVAEPRFKPIKNKVMGVQTPSTIQPEPMEIAMNSRIQVRYCCDICGYTSSEKLMDHYKIHVSNGVFRCHICSKIYHHKPLLQKHLAAHKKKTVQCFVCKKTILDGNLLSAHLLTHMNDESAPVRKKPRLDEKKCQICNAVFASNRRMRKHKRTHPGGELFQCVVCETILTEEALLKKHMSSHEDSSSMERLKQIAIFKCQDCTYQSDLKYKFIYHMMSHTIRRHMLRKNMPEIFECSNCPYVTFRGQYMQNHMKTCS